MMSKGSKSKVKSLYSFTCTESVNSAFFSPTEKLMILTSFDDTIKVFKTDDLFNVQSKNKYTSLDESVMQNSDLYTELSHNNHTGRWLSKFQAHFCPLTSDYNEQSNSYEYFLSGSMKQPRVLDLYQYNFEKKKNVKNVTYRHPLLASVFSLLDVHPYYPVVAGGNSSGRVCVYMKH